MTEVNNIIELATKIEDLAYQMLCNTHAFVPVMTLHREDLEGQGFNTEQLSDDDIDTIANQIHEALLACGYWEIVDTVMETLGYQKETADEQK